MRPDTSTMAEFLRIGELADTTTQLFSLSLHHRAEFRQGQASGIEQVEHLVLQQARDYVGTVREGFVLSVRTSATGDRRELKYLLDRVLLDWAQFSEELGLATDGLPEGERRRIERVRDQLLAFGMAAVALGVLPRLPSHRITFPHSYSTPPTYSDIPVPRSPGEMLERIDELERTIWRLLSADDLQALLQNHYGPLRRTYGFFESSAWLTRRESERFGYRRRKGTSLFD
jgi:hypothetical protein